MVVNYNNVLRPTLVVELSSSFLRYSISRKGPALDYDPRQLGLPSSLGELYGSLRPCFPSVAVTGLGVTIQELASIPAVYVFGPDGKIAKRFDNDNAKKGEDFTYAKDIVPFVEKLLDGTKNEELRTEN